MPGGGACELAVGNFLNKNAKNYSGEEQFPYRALARALEVIPRTLVQNCGGNTIRTLTELRALHAKGQNSHGVNGETGKIADMEKIDIWEPMTVKKVIFSILFRDFGLKIPTKNQFSSMIPTQI